MIADQHWTSGNWTRRRIVASCTGILLGGTGLTTFAAMAKRTPIDPNQGVVLPEDFGAVACSTAAAARADQTVRFQNALDHLTKISPRGTLKLDGWYAVAGLMIPSGITILGSGQATSGLVKFGTLRGPMVSLAPSASGLLFQDVSFSGRNGTEPEVLLSLGIDAGSSTTFRRVTFQESCTAPAVRGNWSSPQHDLRFEDCRFIDLPGGGVQLLPTARGSSDIYFEDSVFARVGGSAICIHHGGSIGDAEFSYNRRIYLRRNHFVSPLFNSIHGDPIPTEIWGWDGGECVDNHVDGGTRGLSAGAGGRGILYARNYIANQTHYAFECGKMRSCTFRDNYAVNCPSMFAFTGGGEKSFDVFDIMIENNHGTGTGLKSPAVGTDYIGSGNDAPVARNLRIINNRFSDLEYIRSAIRFLASHSAPVITITGDGTGATATATFKAIGGRVIDAGAGYGIPPRIIVSGGGGTGAAFECTLGSDGSIARVRLTAPGSGYTSAPDLKLSGGGGSGAVIDASMGIDALQIGNRGSGYSKADITITNNGGYGFKGLVQLFSGSVIGITTVAPGQGFGRGSTVVVDRNQYIARTYNSCANGYQIDGSRIALRDNLWRRSAIFDSRHYQGSDAVAYRQPTVDARSQPIVATYVSNTAEMLGRHETGTLISFGANSRQPVSLKLLSQMQTCRGPFSRSSC